MSANLTGTGYKIQWHNKVMQTPIESKSPFVNWAGIDVVEKSNGFVRANLIIRPEFLNSVGVVHGGIYTSLVDTVAGVALATVVDPDHYFVTSDLICHYLRPTTEGVLAAQAEVTQQGRTTALLAAVVEHRNKQACQATIRFAIRPRNELK